MLSFQFTLINLSLLHGMGMKNLLIKGYLEVDLHHYHHGMAHHVQFLQFHILLDSSWGLNLNRGLQEFLAADTAYLWSCRIVRKWCMNGLGSVGVAKDQDLSVIIIKEGRRLSANAYLALELVLFLFLSLTSALSMFILNAFFV